MDKKRDWRNIRRSAYILVIVIAAVFVAGYWLADALVPAPWTRWIHELLVVLFVLGVINRVSSWLEKREWERDPTQRDWIDRLPVILLIAAIVILVGIYLLPRNLYLRDWMRFGLLLLFGGSLVLLPRWRRIRPKSTYNSPLHWAGPLTWFPYVSLGGFPDTILSTWVFAYVGALTFTSLALIFLAFVAWRWRKNEAIDQAMDGGVGKLALAVGVILFLWAGLWAGSTWMPVPNINDAFRPTGDKREQAEALSRVWVDANLADVFMLAPNLGWAFGMIESEPKTHKSYAVVLRYTNGKWELATGPELADYASIYSVRMDSSISGWALAQGHEYDQDYNGDDYIGRDSVLLRYNKDKWEEVKRFDGEAVNAFTRPAPTTHMLDLDVTSPTEAWIVAEELYLNNSFNFNDIYRVSLTSGEWVRQEITRSVIGPTELAMLSSKAGWAGGVGNLYRFDGSNWQSIPIQWLGHDLTAMNSVSSIEDIQMLSANEGWAIGWVSEEHRYRIWAEEYVPVHYKDGVWRMEEAASGWNLRDLYMISPNEGWAIASTSDDTEDDGYEQAILHYVRGEWKEEQRDSTTNKLNRLFMVSADEGWSVGRHGMILHYQHGKWSVYRE